MGVSPFITAFKRTASMLSSPRATPKGSPTQRRLDIDPRKGSVATWSSAGSGSSAESAVDKLAMKLLYATSLASRRPDIGDQEIIQSWILDIKKYKNDLDKQIAILFDGIKQKGLHLTIDPTNFEAIDKLTLIFVNIYFALHQNKEIYKKHHRKYSQMAKKLYYDAINARDLHLGLDAYNLIMLNLKDYAELIQLYELLKHRIGFSYDSLRNYVKTLNRYTEIKPEIKFCLSGTLKDFKGLIDGVMQSVITDELRQSINDIGNYFIRLFFKYKEYDLTVKVFRYLIALSNISSRLHPTSVTFDLMIRSILLLPSNVRLYNDVEILQFDYKKILDLIHEKMLLKPSIFITSINSISYLFRVYIKYHKFNYFSELMYWLIMALNADDNNKVLMNNGKAIMYSQELNEMIKDFIEQMMQILDNDISGLKLFHELKKRKLEAISDAFGMMSSQRTIATDRITE